MINGIKKLKQYQQLIAWREERLDHRTFLSKYGKQLSALKDIHKGKRCFIIGNGPSLRVEDLEALKDEITFASNFIVKIFDNTEWRPTYFCNSDLGVLSKLKGEAMFKKLTSAINFFQYNSRFVLGDAYPPNSICFYLRDAKNYHIKPKFSTRINDEIYDAFTVTYIAMQIACYMGFSEIYLLGIDNNYNNAVNLSGKHIVQSIRNHFYSNSNEMDNDGGAVPNIERMNLGYLSARDYSRKRGIRICNATRGGKLEIFERIDFDKLIEKAGDK